jgi:hypothetical protein
MMVRLSSFETSVLTRAARCNIPEDAIFHCTYLAVFYSQQVNMRVTKEASDYTMFPDITPFLFLDFTMLFNALLSIAVSTSQCRLCTVLPVPVMINCTVLISEVPFKKMFEPSLQKWLEHVIFHICLNEVVVS